MNIEFLKSDNFYKQFNKTGKTPTARLIGLSNILNKWNKRRLKDIVNENDADLSISDIQTLKIIIENETTKVKLNNSEIVADQILFLLIGAIKIQIQNKTEEPWELVNKSIANFLTPRQKYSNQMIWLSMFTIIIVIGFAITLMTPNKKNTISHEINPTEISSENLIKRAGSETVTNLITIFRAMKEGECQLPQAAMLQAKEREAFISFVTEGKVSIQTAENLKNALKYTNCQYPQKLMNNPLNRAP